MAILASEIDNSDEVVNVRVIKKTFRAIVTDMVPPNSIDKQDLRTFITDSAIYYCCREGIEGVHSC